MLVFVKYNLQLEMRQMMRKEMGDTCDLICVSYIGSTDAWIIEKDEPRLSTDAS